MLTRHATYYINTYSACLSKFRNAKSELGTGTCLQESIVKIDFTTGPSTFISFGNGVNLRNAETKRKKKEDKSRHICRPPTIRNVMTTE